MSDGDGSAGSSYGFAPVVKRLTTDDIDRLGSTDPTAALWNPRLGKVITPQRRGYAMATDKTSWDCKVFKALLRGDLASQRAGIFAIVEGNVASSMEVMEALAHPGWIALSRAPEEIDGTMGQIPLDACAPFSDTYACAYEKMEEGGLRPSAFYDGFDGMWVTAVQMEGLASAICGFEARGLPLPPALRGRVCHKTREEPNPLDLYFNPMNISCCGKVVCAEFDDRNDSYVQKAYAAPELAEAFLNQDSQLSISDVRELEARMTIRNMSLSETMASLDHERRDGQRASCEEMER